MDRSARRRRMARLNADVVPDDEIDYVKQMVKAAGYRAGNFTAILNNPTDDIDPASAASDAFWTMKHMDLIMHSPGPRQLPGQGHAHGVLSPAVVDHRHLTSRREPLPLVTSEHFQEYISGFGQEYQRFHARRKTVGQSGSRVSDFTGSLLSLSAGGGATSVEEQDGDEDHDSSSLEGIPEIFFREEFSLSSPDLFMSLQKEASKGHSLLMDRMSTHLDMVEMQLIRQISRRSKDIFSALLDIYDLHRKIRETCGSIAAVRRRIGGLDNSLVARSLRVAALRRKRHNAVKLHELLHLVSTVQQAQTTIQLLLSSSDFAGALDLVASSKRVLRTKLAGVHSFKSLWVSLSEMSANIEEMMQADFMQGALFRCDIGDGAKNGGGAEIQQMDMSAPDATCDSLSELVPLVLGLLRVGRMGRTLQAFRDEVVQNFRPFFRSTVVSVMWPSSASDEAHSPEEIAQKARELDAYAFLELLGIVLPKMLGYLARVASIRDLVIQHAPKSTTRENVPGRGGRRRSMGTASAEVALAYGGLEEEFVTDTDGAYGLENQSIHPIPERDPVSVVGSSSTVRSSPQTSNDDEVQLEANLAKEATDVVVAVGVECQGRVSQLLQLRDEIHSKLPANDFVRLYHVIDRFVLGSDSVCKQPLRGLKSASMVQAKSFLSNFHSKRIQSLATLLDSETWVPAEVPVEFQRLIDRWARDVNDSSGDAIVHGDHDEEQVAPAQSLVIGSRKIKVVGTALMLLKFVDGYLDVLSTLPALVVDMLSKVVELLKLFNSRTCQLVLGAGALQVAGLKSITASHLALASQCLGLVIAQVPHFRRALMKHLDPVHHVLLGEMQRVAEDCGHHREEIFAKLVSIMRERVDYHCQGLAKVRWDEDIEGGVSPCMISLGKETSMLHKKLASVLQKEEVRQIFSQVAAMFTSRLKEHIGKCTFNTPLGRRRLKQDAKHVLSVFAGLKHVPSPSSELLDYIQALPTTHTQSGTIGFQSVTSNTVEQERPPYSIQREIGSAVTNTAVTRSPSPSVPLPPSFSQSARRFFPAHGASSSSSSPAPSAAFKPGIAFSALLAAGKDRGKDGSPLRKGALPVDAAATSVPVPPSASKPNRRRGSLSSGLGRLDAALGSPKDEKSLEPGGHTKTTSASHGQQPLADTPADKSVGLQPNEKDVDKGLVKRSESLMVKKTQKDDEVRNRNTSLHQRTASFNRPPRAADSRPVASSTTVQSTPLTQSSRSASESNLASHSQTELLPDETGSNGDSSIQPVPAANKKSVWQDLGFTEKKFDFDLSKTAKDLDSQFQLTKSKFTTGFSGVLKKAMAPADDPSGRPTGSPHPPSADKLVQEESI